MQLRARARRRRLTSKFEADTRLPVAVRLVSNSPADFERPLHPVGAFWQREEGLKGSGDGR